MTDDISFAGCWVREKKGADIVINSYELDETGLKIKRFDRDKEWFKYIFSNRRSRPDELAEYDLIIGPIANDTIYDTMGIMTSGYLTDEEALKLLSVGPCYRQFTIKTEKAVKQLRFVEAKKLSAEEIKKNSKFAAEEAEKYLTEFANVMQDF
jgi:hypothetical protein